VQAEFEQCDDGAENGRGRCLANCQLGQLR
jgi:hypothetical protein